MGLLQKACETYDNLSDKVGVEESGKAVLLPLSHTVTSANIEITLDSDGNFVKARSVDKSEPKIIIPVTEESAGRTSAPCAHPLCDQLGYVAGFDEKKHKLYTDQLEKWTYSENSHPMLKPILKYIKSGTVLDDLQAADLIGSDQKELKEKEKSMICWRVIGCGAGQEACWLNKELFDAYVNRYGSKLKMREKNFCMISGELDIPTTQHPKGIIPICGNAKLISANDSSGFTYRGRFTSDDQAVSISYNASQKAHNALRWLIANFGVNVGGRTFLCWNPENRPVPQAAFSLCRNLSAAAGSPKVYKEELKKALFGYKTDLPDESDVIIAAFDAATTGRLSVTYYNELRASDFLQRLYDWDETCCWWNGAYGIQSPTLFQLVNYALGTHRDGKIETDDRMLKQHMQQLMSCRVDKVHFPDDIQYALVQKVANLQIYEPKVREQLLFVACAATHKYRYDKYKEVWSMSLEEKNSDRSYQFGRLIAVLEKIERDTYSADEERETNAVRMLPMFSQRPMETTRKVYEQLKKAYMPRLKPYAREYYHKEIGQIMEQLSQCSEREINKPLGDTYLFGYYLQRNALYTSKKKTEIETESETEEK